MSYFRIQGRSGLAGTFRPSGNKNAALPILAGCLLTDQPVRLSNVPDIVDVRTMAELLASLGVEVRWEGSNELAVHARELTEHRVDEQLASRIRASVLLAGPLLARLGEIELPPPGGDVIGRRRLDTHFLALQSLGAEIESNGSYYLRSKGLGGVELFLDEPSVTGTENAILAAVTAEGTTRFRNAAAFAAYVGVVPATRLSGLHRPTRARISSIGNARLRKALWMPVLSSVRHNPWLRDYYQRLRERGKYPKVALTAAMRKLVTAIYSVAKHRRPFTNPPPNHTSPRHPPPT